MAATFLRADAPGGFVPIVDLPLRLGSRADCTLWDASPGVAPQHALLTREAGTYRLSATPGATVEIGGHAVASADLVDGDRVRLAPGAAPWRFRLQPADVPALPRPETSHVQVVTYEDMRCAFKHLPPLRMEQPQRRHLKLLAQLGGAPHPALAALVAGGFTTIGGRPRRWLATRWAEGTSVREQLEEGGLPIRRALSVLHALAEGVVHLHQRGVIHRDIAPGNVILTAEDRGVLIDYGHAVLTDAPLPDSHGVVGTPGYVAPEEVVHGPAAVTPAVDVYGLAAVGYCLLTGAPPSGGADVLDALAGAAHVPPRPTAAGVDLSPTFEDMLLAALGPEPATRPDAAAFATAARRAARELGELV